MADDYVDPDLDSAPIDRNLVVAGVSIGLAIAAGIGAYFYYKKRNNRITPLMSETMSVVEGQLLSQGITVSQDLKDLYALHGERMEKEMQEWRDAGSPQADHISDTPVTKVTRPSSSNEPRVQINDTERRNTVTKTSGTSTEVVLPDVDGKLVGPFEFPMKDFKKAIDEEKACAVCFKKPEDGLKKCGNCKITYYCGGNCQKEGFTTHKLRCEELSKSVTNFEKIRQVMKRFNPKELHLIDAQYGNEAWSIVSSALKGGHYNTDLELATLLMWAGTSNAILSGHALRSRPLNGPPSYQQLFDVFAPSMNLYYNALEICLKSDDPQMLSVAPYCQFEIFGLWTMLATTLEQNNPQRMGAILQNASIVYGMNSIAGLVQLLADPSSYPGTDVNMAFSYLQGWTLANINILTRDLITMGHATEISVLLDRLYDTTKHPEAMTCSATAQAYCAASVLAADAVVKEYNLTPDKWTQEQNETFGRTRESIAEKMLARTVPGYFQHQQAQQAQMAAQGGPPVDPNAQPPFSPRSIQANYDEMRGQMKQMREHQRQAQQQMMQQQQASQ